MAHLIKILSNIKVNVIIMYFELIPIKQYKNVYYEKKF